MASDLLSQWTSALGPSPSAPAQGPGPSPAEVDARNFRQRVTMAAIAAAIAISNEAPITTNHLNRVALAKLVANSGGEQHAFALAVASQGLDQASTDAQINTMIAAVWNTLAGV